MDTNLPLAAALAQGIPGVVAVDSKVELVQEGIVSPERHVRTRRWRFVLLGYSRRPSCRTARFWSRGVMSLRDLGIRTIGAV